MGKEPSRSYVPVPPHRGRETRGLRRQDAHRPAGEQPADRTRDTVGPVFFGTIRTVNSTFRLRLEGHYGFNVKLPIDVVQIELTA